MSISGVLCSVQLCKLSSLATSHASLNLMSWLQYVTLWWTNVSLSLSSWSFPSILPLSGDKDLFVRKRNHRTHMLWTRESERSQREIGLLRREGGREAEWGHSELEKGTSELDSCEVHCTRLARIIWTWRVRKQKQRRRQKVKWAFKKLLKRCFRQVFAANMHNIQFILTFKNQMLSLCLETATYSLSKFKISSLLCVFSDQQVNILNLWGHIKE